MQMLLGWNQNVMLCNGNQHCIRCKTDRIAILQERSRCMFLRSFHAYRASIDKRISRLNTYFYLTIMPRGQTLRAGVAVDCARTEEKNRGMQDNDWWLKLYVMFSRAARMQDMLLLRPPPRAFLEKGPPAGVCAALASFGTVA